MSGGPRVRRDGGAARARALGLAAVGCLLLAEVPAVRAQDPEGPDPSRPLGAPAAFASSDHERIELPSGARLHRAPTPSSSVAFEFSGDGTERAEVLDRRETASGVWIRVRFAGIYGWYRQSMKEVDQIAALYENPARMERRKRLVELARARFETSPTELVWPLSTPDRDLDVPVRIHAELDRRSMRRVRELAVCVPELYAERFGAAVPSRVLPVEIFVFDDAEEYDEFARAELATSIQESGGLEIDGLVFIKGGASEWSNLGTLAHELAHVLNRFAFPEGALPLWIEEGVAEDLALAVEAGLVEVGSPCSRPGGWARTRVQESTEFVEGRPTRRTDVQRTGRGRAVVCYDGPAADDPDIRELTTLEFGASYRRDVLYLEAALLLRDLIAGIRSPADFRSVALDWRLATDARRLADVAERVLGPLAWRATERTWMECP